MSTETIKRIINNLEIKKPCSGEISTFLNDVILFCFVIVCVKEALKTLSFPDSLKCANVTPIYKKRTLLIKNL